MLIIKVPAIEMFDEEKEEFVNIEETTLTLEHSLVSLWNWESKWEKPFLGPAEKTTEETYGYIQAMSLNGEIPPEVFSRISNENLKEINEYIESKMAATWFKDTPSKVGSREVVTAEIIYYWMWALNIPMECQHWHLNRLFTQIRVVNEKNKPQQKRPMRDVMLERKALNEQRQREMGTTG